MAKNAVMDLCLLYGSLVSQNKFLALHNTRV